MLAARRALATVEEIVDELTPVPGGVVLPPVRSTRSRSCPGGAAPVVRARLLRPRQRRLPRRGTQISRDRETFTAWLRRRSRRASRRRANRIRSGANREPHGRGDDDRRRGPRAARRPGVFVGIDLPSRRRTSPAACTRPTWCSIYESGTIDTRPDELPLSIGDGVLADVRAVVVGVPEVFNYWLQAGPDRRRLPLRRPDRPLRQPQHHGDRRVRRARRAAPRRRRCAGDRRGAAAR